MRRCVRLIRCKIDRFHLLDEGIELGFTSSIKNSRQPCSNVLAVTDVNFYLLNSSNYDLCCAIKRSMLYFKT